MTAIRSAILVGGGIVGLVAGRALALQGIEVTLLERRAAIEDQAGIGIGLQNNAMNALAEIGLAEAVVGAGVPVETLHVYSAAGVEIGRRPAERYLGSPWPGFTGLSRAALHAILAEGARAAGVTLMTEAEVNDMAGEQGAAEVRLADGRRLTGDLVIGCDGIHSRVRALFFPEHANPLPTGEGVWRGLVPNVRRNDVSFIFGSRVGTMGYCPLPHDVYLHMVDRDENAPPRDAPDLAERMERLADGVRGPPADLARQLSRAPGDVSYRRLEAVQLPAPWHRGRVLVIGDAAHAGPPTLAQGAAMGIEDGIVLAQCLAAHSALGDALDAFMARRWERVNIVVSASLAISRAQMEPGGQAAMAAANASAARALALPY